MSFSVKSGVSGPLHRIPSAASCNHTQCAWQYQSRQLPGCWSRSTVMRPRGTSTSTVERDQQPGSCRDWYCHAHWVWLHDAADGILWSGPDTPLFTLNDIFRGQWRRTIEPDGTLFAYVLNNVPSGSIVRRHWPRKMSFSVKSGVSG